MGAKHVNPISIVHNVLVIIILTHQQLYVSVVTQIVSHVLVLLKINVQVVTNLYTLSQISVIILHVHMVNM